MSWRAGDVIVLREVIVGRVRSARPLLVLADEPEGLVGYLAPRSQVAWPRLVDGAQSQTPDQGWVLRLEQWQGPGCLFQLPSGEAYGAVLFLDPGDGNPLGWKIDFLAPVARTSLGVDTLDWALDLLASADLSSWTVKDEDDLAQLQLLRALDDDELAELKSARERVETAMAARDHPFSGKWADWRPPPGGVPPLTLPAGWDVIDANGTAEPGRTAMTHDKAGPPYQSGHGSRVLDAAGHIWLDLDLSGGSLLHGHAHPAVVGAISRQAGLGLGLGMRRPADGAPPVRALGEVLARRYPGLDGVAWADSGRRALQLGLEAARRVSGRPVVASWSTVGTGFDLLHLPPDPTAARLALRAEADRLAVVVIDALSFAGDPVEAADAADPAKAADAGWPGLRDELLRLAESGTVLVADERRTLGAGARGGHGVLGLADGSVGLVIHGASLFGGLGGGAVCGWAALLDGLGPAASRNGDHDGRSWSIHPILAAAALATLQLATPAALDALAERAARLRTALGLPGFGAAARLPATVDTATLSARRVNIDPAGWAWLATVSDDDDVGEAIEALLAASRR